MKSIYLFLFIYLLVPLYFNSMENSYINYNTIHFRSTMVSINTITKSNTTEFVFTLLFHYIYLLFLLPLCCTEFSDFNKKYQKKLVNSDIKIKLVNVRFQFGMQLNLDKMIKVLQPRRNGICYMKYNDSTANLEIDIENEYKKCYRFRIYSNGTCYVFGCRNMKDFRDMSQRLINEIANSEYDENLSTIGINNVQTLFVAAYRLGFRIDCEEMVALLNRDGITNFEYYTFEKYPRIIIRKNRLKSIIFPSGDVFINFCQNIEDINEMYIYLNDLVTQYEDEIKIIE